MKCDNNEIANVSVIIPCYKSTSTIERAVASIASQTLRPKEIILVEDGSPDKGATLASLMRIKDLYIGHFNIIVVALPKNSGPSVARNIGWENSTQPYIAFLDSDDSWHPEKINIQYGWMRMNSSIVLTGHEYMCLDCEPVQHHIPQSTEFESVTLSSLLRSNKFQTSSVMLKRSVNARFDVNKRFCEDYQLWLDILLEGSIAQYLPIKLGYIFRRAFSAGGLSGDLWSMEKGELSVYRRIYKKRLISVFNYSFLICHSLVKFSYRFFSNNFQKLIK